MVLLEKLEKLLKQKAKVNGDEAWFWCPACAKSNGKKKLVVNLESGNWHCWVCQDFNEMRGLTPNSLVKKLGIESSDKLFSRSNIFGKSPIKQKKIVEFKLPGGLIDLSDIINDNVFNLHASYAIGYLKKRGITNSHIESYSLKFSKSGKYSNRIIIPSYSSDDQLNYWLARSVYDSNYRYLNPDGLFSGIFFESMINKNWPITLVEGPFDAMKLGRNSIPLLGVAKFSNIYYWIIENNIKHINLMFDNDEPGIALTNMAAYELISSGITVSISELPKKYHDPGATPIKELIKIHSYPQIISSNDVLKMEILNGVKHKKLSKPMAKNKKMGKSYTHK